MAFKPFDEKKLDVPSRPRWIDQLPGFQVSAISHWDALPGSRGFLIVKGDAGHLPDLWLAKQRKSAAEQLTYFNAELDRYAMGKTRHVEWTDAHGRQLTGALLLPAAYEVGKRYPTLVDCYGGRTAATVTTMQKAMGLLSDSSPEWNYQALASRGYAIFAPEAPYGENTVMKDLAEAVLPGVDRIVASGIADLERLAIAGQSFGGYCVRALIVQTDRFKAAISTAGANGNAFSSFPYLWPQLRISPDSYKTQEGRDIFIRNSPLWYYDRVKTPLLLQIGMNDAIGNSAATDQDYDVLSYLSIPVQRLDYYGEDHVLSGYSNQVDFWNRRIEWLEKYLKESRQ